LQEFFFAMGTELP